MSSGAPVLTSLFLEALSINQPPTHGESKGTCCRTTVILVYCSHPMVNMHYSFIRHAEFTYDNKPLFINILCGSACSSIIC